MQVWFDFARAPPSCPYYSVASNVYACCICCAFPCFLGSNLGKDTLFHAGSQSYDRMLNGVAGGKTQIYRASPSVPGPLRVFGVDFTVFFGRLRATIRKKLIGISNFFIRVRLLVLFRALTNACTFLESLNFAQVICVIIFKDTPEVPQMEHRQENIRENFCSYFRVLRPFYLNFTL